MSFSELNYLYRTDTNLGFVDRGSIPEVPDIDIEET
jgi:hypothetical protein